MSVGTVNQPISWKKETVCYKTVRQASKNNVIDVWWDGRKIKKGIV